jgi:hypothetical protein
MATNLIELNSAFALISVAFHDGLEGVTKAKEGEGRRKKWKRSRLTSPNEFEVNLNFVAVCRHFNVSRRQNEMFEARKKEKTCRITADLGFDDRSP